MSILLTILTVIGFLGTLVVGILFARRAESWALLGVWIAIEVAFLVVLNRLLGFPIPHEVIEKSPRSEIVLVLALYVSMILGMASQSAYSYIEGPRPSRVKWSWAAFIAPILVSPIVFIPMYGAFAGSMDVSTSSTPRLMIFLVAYQNGFFWKDFFERRQSEEKKK